MKRIFAIGLLCVLSGCMAKPQSVRSYMPLLDKPERPQLEALTADETIEFSKISPALKTKLIGNSDRLQLYALKFEYKIDAYNSFAKAANDTSNAAMGITKPESVGGGK